jgi:hypothetical protein
MVVQGKKHGFLVRNSSAWKDFVWDRDDPHDAVDRLRLIP